MTSSSRTPRRPPTRQVALRLAPDILRRIAALRPQVASRADLAAFGRVTTTTVMKLALLRGLDALEAEYK
jgi:hypothetical protein